jgi:antitoxin VapB
MIVHDTRIIRCGGVQTVEIPSEFAFADDVIEVRIVRSGSGLMVSAATPVGSWKEYFERGPYVSEDFMSERVDPPPQERDFSGWG